MKTEYIKHQGYTTVYNVYEAGVDFDPSDAFVTLKTLSRYDLHPGYGLWRVGATYARNLKPSFYYVVSTSKADAVIKFLNTAPWLSIVQFVVPLSNEDAEVVLNNPAKFALW